MTDRSPASKEALTVGGYIKRAPRTAQSTLRKFRAVARAAAPDAEERIRYGMPYLVYRGRPVVGFAAYTQHISMFGSVRGFEREFRGYDTARGTVRFPHGTEVPWDLVRRYVAARYADAHAPA